MVSDLLDIIDHSDDDGWLDVIYFGFAIDFV